MLSLNPPPMQCGGPVRPGAAGASASGLPLPFSTARRWQQRRQQRAQRSGRSCGGTGAAGAGDSSPQRTAGPRCHRSTQGPAHVSKHDPGRNCPGCSAVRPVFTHKPSGEQNQGNPFAEQCFEHCHSRQQQKTHIAFLRNKKPVQSRKTVPEKIRSDF